MMRGESWGRRMRKGDRKNWHYREGPGKGTFPGGCVSSINLYCELLGTENWWGARYFTFRRSLVNQPNLSQSLASFLISSQEATVGRGIRLWLISRHLHVNHLRCGLLFARVYSWTAFPPPSLRSWASCFLFVSNLTLWLQHRVKCWSYLLPLSLEMV